MRCPKCGQKTRVTNLASAAAAVREAQQLLDDASLEHQRRLSPYLDSEFRREWNVTHGKKR